MAELRGDYQKNYQDWESTDAKKIEALMKPKPSPVLGETVMPNPLTEGSPEYWRIQRLHNEQDSYTRRKVAETLKRLAIYPDFDSGFEDRIVIGREEFDQLLKDLEG